MSINLDKHQEYILVGVQFYHGGKIYEYLSDTDSYNSGDIVYIEDPNGEIKEVVVNSVRRSSEDDFPVPSYKMKYILHKKYAENTASRNIKNNTQVSTFHTQFPEDRTYQRNLQEAPKITKKTDFNGGFYNTYDDEPLQELYSLIGTEALEHIKKLFYNMYFDDDPRIKSLLV